MRNTNVGFLFSTSAATRNHSYRLLFSCQQCDVSLNQPAPSPRNYFRKKTYDDRELEKVLKNFAGVSSKAYQSMMEPGCRLSKQIGNTYTASVFANIVSLVDAHGASLEGRTALIFSYGSG